jgi:hypothetical protein
MIDPVALALELFEYKMDDLRHRRTVRGGVDSVWTLRRELTAMADRLDGEQARRFRELSRELGEREAGPGLDGSAHEREVVGFDALVLGGPSDREAPLEVGEAQMGGTAFDLAAELVLDDEDEAPQLAAPDRITPLSDSEKREQEALQRLAQRVFGREIDRFAEGSAAAWRAERERVTARLLYATLRNLERFRATDAFSRDVNLRQFKVVEPLPARVDPLVSLSDVDSLAVIARDVIEAILHLRDGSPAPQLDRRQSLDYVKRLALEVAKDPYAGKRAPEDPRGPSSSELRAALRDLARERLPDWQRQARREDLEARLRERHEIERDQRSMLRRDTQRFAESVEAFFGRLARLLPRSVGGDAEEPQLVGGVLFALSPGLRRNDLPADARAITVRMAGPVRLPFAGRELTVAVEAAVRRLFIAGTEVALDDDEVVEIGGDEFETFVEGDYLHVRVRESGGSLASRVAEAAATLHVLAGPNRQAHLAVLRMLAPGAPGDPAGLVVEALRRAGQIVARAPKRRDALARLIAGAARGVGHDIDEAWLQGFVQRAHLALTAKPESLPEALTMLTSMDPAAEEPSVVPFTGDPVDIAVGGRTITVRRYGVRGSDHVVAMLPGQVIGSFREHLVERMGGGTFVCIHGQQQVVVAFLPETAIPSAHDL